MTATIMPLPDGTSLLERDGHVHLFPHFWAALDEARTCGVAVKVERFPDPSVRVLADLDLRTPLRPDAGVPA